MKHVIYTMVAMIAFTSMQANAAANRVYTRTVVKQAPKQVTGHTRPIVVKAQAPKKSVLDDYEDMGGADLNKEADYINTSSGVKTYYTANTVRTRVRTIQPTVPTKSIFRLAPYGAYTNSSWSGAKQTDSTFSSMDGYAAGMTVLIGNGRLHGETGLQYATRGANFTGRLKNSAGIYTQTTGDIEINTKYLEIPAYARFNVIDHHRVEVYAKAGVVLGLLQSVESNISNVKSSGFFGPYVGGNTVDAEQTTGNPLNNTDTRWSVGAGTNVRLMKFMSLSLDGNYERSFGVINKSGDNDTYLSGFMARAGLVFDL